MGSGGSDRRSAEPGTGEGGGSGPDLRVLGEAIQYKANFHVDARGVSPDRFANFVDSHDEMRILSRCGGDTARTLAVVTTMMLLRGVPVIFYGTEQGLAETDEDDRRISLWRTQYDQDKTLTRVIGKINQLRRREHIETAQMTLHLADRSTIVLSRGATAADAASEGAGVWLFANNDDSSKVEQPHRYCPPELPRAAPAGWHWKDELSGEAAVFEGGCLLASDGIPKVLVLARAIEA